MPQYIPNGQTVVVRALQWIGTNLDDIIELGATVEPPVANNPLRIKIGLNGAKGFADVKLTDYVVRHSEVDFDVVTYQAMSAGYRRVGL